MSRRLVAAGKSVPTPGGHRGLVLEFNRKGIKPAEVAEVPDLRLLEEDPEEPDTDCHCGHPECGAC